MTAHAGDVFATKGAFRQRLLRLAAQKAGVCTAVSVPLGKCFPIYDRDQSGGDSYGCRPVAILPKTNPKILAKQKAKDCAFFFVGRLAEKKGIQYLIRATDIVRRRFPDVRLTIVGGRSN